MNGLPDFTQQGYEVIEQLGHNLEGGRITYLAKDTETSNKVVIKEFCFAQENSNWSGYKTHEREIEILKKLTHPRIPRYLNSYETIRGFCLVQEYKNAPSLAKSSNFSSEEIKKIAISILEILVYLQSGYNPVFHRDIKPENILIDANLNAYLIDFGFGKIGTSSLALSSIISGTIGFMPHEQLYFQVTKASDLYSLGVTLICLLTQTPSTQVNQLISVKGGLRFDAKITRLHPAFVDWLKKMTAPDVQDRFSDAKTALNKLNSIPIEGLSLSQKMGIFFTSSKQKWGLLREKGIIKYATIIIILGVIGWQATIKVKAEFERKEAERIAQEKKEEAERIAQENARIAQNNAQRMIITKKCPQCNLQNIDLSNYYLAGFNLEGANLRHTKLPRSLENINLEGANLQNNDLRFSYLERANLQRANLQGSDLTGANLERANLQGANLQGANLGKANFKGVNLEGANLEGVQIGESRYTHTDFEGANLQGANLQKADLEGADLQRANLQRANLQDADLGDTYLMGANLQGANLQGADLEKANFKGANLQGANLRGATGILDFRGANLRNAIMPNGQKYEEWIKK